MKKVVSILFLLAFVITGFGAAFDPVYRRVNSTGTGIQDVIMAAPPANTFTIRGLTNGVAYEVAISDGMVAEDISGQWYIWVDLQGLMTDQPDIVAPAEHTHEMTDVDGLEEAMDEKADVGHGHAISDVTGLQTALDGKASTSHTHVIADTAGLQTALDGKSPTSHNHDATYAAIGHNHNGVYATVSHTHTTNDLSQVNSHLANLLSQIQALQAGVRQEYSTNVTTGSDGTYTWTFPSSFPSAPTVILSPVDNTSGIRYDWKVTAVSTTSASVLITRRQDQLISLLGLNIGVNASQAATAIHLHATR